jgi:hypothetical protein
MRTFQDRNFLVWEVYPSGDRHIFHCLTKPELRSRFVEAASGDGTGRIPLVDATPDDLLDLLERAEEIV